MSERYRRRGRRRERRRVKWTTHTIRLIIPATPIQNLANSGSDEPEPHTLYLCQLHIFDHIFDWQQALPAASPNTKEHNQALNPNVTQTAKEAGVGLTTLNIYFSTPNALIVSCPNPVQ
jgi:hypothetical protein